MPISRRQLFEAGAAMGVAAAIQSAQVSSAVAQQSSLSDAMKELIFSASAGANTSANILRQWMLGTATYYIVEIVDSLGDFEISEPIIIKEPLFGGSVPVVLDDFAGVPPLPINESGWDQDQVDISLFSFRENDSDVSRKPGTKEEALSAANDKKVFATAKSSVEKLISKTAPGTNGGRLACAWAVNQIVKVALGTPVGGGLATSNMVKVLAARHFRLSSAPDSRPTPGSIVISPTVYYPKANIGHVGIVGENGDIYSNSSNHGRWEKNFTVDRWRSYFVEHKGLAMQYYLLDDVYFPGT
ncbi:CHAP domain-containing protein [Mesorhizobium australicum]|uniref:CHAP domain-containing protein n=1 Tax=Mesorhizobium australicum TaxID=536018 RepID=UPI0033375E5D